MSKKAPRCAIIDGPCPKNGDPEKGRYCPHWAVEPEKNDATGETRVNEGCDIPMLRQWQIEAMRAGWVSARFISLLGTDRVQRQLQSLPEDEPRRLGNGEL